MVRSVAHVCFVVKDLEAAERFYTEVIGLKHAFDFLKETGERFGVYLHAGGRTFIELFTGNPAQVAGGSYQHVCFEVDDVTAAVETIRARGWKVSDATLGSDDSWQAWVSDPDGNSIELHSYTAGSLQAPWVSERP